MVEAMGVKGVMTDIRLCDVDERRPLNSWLQSTLHQTDSCSSKQQSPEANCRRDRTTETLLIYLNRRGSCYPEAGLTDADTGSPPHAGGGAPTRIAIPG
jgi:hypothetical protein